MERTQQDGPSQLRAILEERLPPKLVLEDDFERWYEQRFKRKLDVAAAAIRGGVEAALDAERKSIRMKEGSGREVWQLFLGNGLLTKSAASARSKVGRDLLERRQEDREGPPGRLSMDQVDRLVASFPDLGRFRISAPWIRAEV